MCRWWHLHPHLRLHSRLQFWLHYRCAELQVRIAISNVDVDGDGELGFKEFVQMLANPDSSLSGEIEHQLRELREMFSLFDPDGDGAITGAKLNANRASQHALLWLVVAYRSVWLC